MSEDLKRRIRDSLNNLVTLEIITAVGHVRLKPDAESTGENDRDYPDIDYERDPKMILTKIDLLQGDIKTVYNEEFVTGNYKDLREFHAEREKEGHRIIMQNISVLEKLLKLISEFTEE